MTTITPMQFRAARSYLGLTQEELAQLAKISPATVRRAEDMGGALDKNVDALRNALENAGIEFIEDEGVKWRHRSIRMYQGADSCDRFFSDVMLEIENKGGDFHALIKSKDILAKPYGQNNRSNLERMRQLHNKAPIKCLVSDAIDTSFLAPSPQFRIVPNQYGGPESFFVYGNKYVLAFSEERSSPFFCIYNMAFFAQTYRTHFLMRWQNALPLVKHGQPMQRIAASSI